MMTIDPGGRTSHFNAVLTKHDFLNDLGAKLDITPSSHFSYSSSWLQGLAKQNYRILLISPQIHAKFKCTPSWPKPYYIPRVPSLAHFLNELFPIFSILILFHLKSLPPPDLLRNGFSYNFTYTSASHNTWKTEFVQYICILSKPNQQYSRLFLRKPPFPSF